ncbi:MAG: hypothetical protein AAGK14_00315 [Verrucomicrobiota bacterium]
MRKTNFSYRVCALAVLALTAWNTPVQAAPPLAEIIEKGVARAEQQEKQLTGWQFDQTIIAEALNSEGEPDKRQEIDMIITVHENGPEAEIVAERGEPLIPQIGENDRQRIRQEIDANRNELELRDKLKFYQVEYLGEGKVQERPVYILKFYPKEGIKPDNRFDKVLGNLSGRVWVDQRDYSVLQSEGKLVKPTELAWFLAKLQELEFKYSAQPIPVGWGPRWINMRFKVNLGPFKVFHRHFMTMDNFRKAAG